MNKKGFPEKSTCTPLPPGEGMGVREPKSKLPASLLSHARELRQQMTEAEEYLWQLLRNRKFMGLKFRRQHPVMPGFVLDFYCDAHKLAIELDGSIHDDIRQKEYDAGRSDELETMGIRVIRFRNEEVLSDVEHVLERIALVVSRDEAGLNERDG